MNRGDDLKQEISIRCNSASIPVEKLLEHVTKSVEQKFRGKKDSLGGQKVISFLVEEECLHSLDQHIAVVSHRTHDSDFISADKESKEDRILGLAKKYEKEREKEYKELASKNADGNESIADINKPVQDGGKTALHLAVLAGDLSEVVRLVEDCGAKTNVKDNMRVTPYKISLDYGLEDISEYLKQSPH
jgi:ankyrin repeat protein